MKKILNLFKLRLKLVQQGYNLGWEHGYQAGMDEQHKQILDLLNKHIHDIDWTKEDIFTVKDVIPVVEDHIADKEPVGWK
jgi:flagellar biosynthesis/type III secretory pathway protein FliH